MQCPRDRSELVPLVRRAATLDRASAAAARGTRRTSSSGWRRPRSASRRRPPTWRSRFGAPAAFVQEVGRDPQLACPRCGTRMRKLRFEGAGFSVIGDRCDGCLGSWFDAGEHGPMIALLEERAGQRVRPAVAAAAAVLALAAALVFFYVLR